MSYNINHSEYIGKGRLSIKPSDARRLRKKHKNNLPEGCFLTQVFSDEDDAPVVIEKPLWYGEFSGHSYEESLPDILACTTGKAKLRFIWEGGDSETALVVNNGTIKKARVKVEVVEE